MSARPNNDPPPFGCFPERRVSRRRGRRTDDELPAAEAMAAQRLRLTGELHDYTLQSLVAASQDLDEVEDDPQALLFAQRSVSRAIGELRELLTTLNAPTPGPSAAVGDRRGALLDFIDDAARRGGFRTSVRIDPAADSDHSVLLHLLVRELVGNVAKHAAATHVALALTIRLGWVELCVQDDGEGMAHDPTVAPDDHFGLRLAATRVDQVGGTLQFTAPVTGGTTVTVRLPVGRALTTSPGVSQSAPRNALDPPAADSVGTVRVITGTGVVQAPPKRRNPRMTNPIRPAQHPQTEPSPHDGTRRERLGPLTPDRQTPLGDTPEAHDEIIPEDLPKAHPGRSAAERQAADGDGTTRGDTTPRSRAAGIR